MREIIAEVVSARKAARDGHLNYLCGLGLFSEADANYLPDDLHPNPAGYRRIGETFAERVLSDQGLLGSML